MYFSTAMSAHRKHILILSSWYPNRTAPFLGNFVQQQAKLIAEAFQVTVLYTVADETINTIETIVTENGNLKEIIIYHPKGSNFYSRKKEQDKAFDLGLKMVKDVDLIHAHVLLPKGYLFVRAKKEFSCQLIVTEHASYYRKERRKKWNLKEKFILNYVKKHIDKLIAVSEFQREDIAAYFDVTPIDVVYNPINTELFQPLVSKPANEKKQFLHISTLDKEVKNPIGIIDAVELLVRKGYHDFELTIVSDESYTELHKYAEQKSLSAYIHFAGPFEHEDLLPFYQKSDAFVLFSNYESFSIVLAEAWSCGLPTLTTPVGIGFNLQAEYGIQVKINDSLSLAMAMEKIIHNHTFDSNIIRAKSQTYSMQNILSQLSTIYNQLNG